MKFIRVIMASMVFATMATACCDSNADAEKCDKNCVIENIMARRSIRNYKPETVDRETMKKILECGINAPNGQNKQSWEVRVVDNPAIMEEIKAIMAAAYPEEEAKRVTGCFRGAPVMTFIARDLSYDFSAYDCGLLAENMMLSAWSMGIGSCCLGSVIPVMLSEDAKPYYERLQLPEDYKLLMAIAFGYPEGEIPTAPERDATKAYYVE